MSNKRTSNKRNSGSNTPNNNLNTKENTMKRQTAKPQANGKKANTGSRRTSRAKAIDYTENTLNHPVDIVLDYTPLAIPSEGLSKRDVTIRSTEWRVQVMILDGATNEEIRELFTQIYQGERNGNPDSFVAKRAKKYTAQERNRIAKGHIINR